METKRSPEEKKASTTIKEECSIAFEAFWAKGIEFYFQAFLDGSPIADRQLALWRMTGKNDKAIEIWRDRLAEQKNTKGELFLIQEEVLLGIIHFNWTKDYEKARSCFENAAQANHVIAQYYLGEMNEFGKGFAERDKTLALQFYESAATDPTPSLSAICILGVAHSTATHGIKEKNQQAAYKYYIQAATLGDAVAAYNSGVMLLKEKPEEKNDKTAIGFLRQAAAGGNWRALIELANLYSQGRGVPKDEIESSRLYELAAEISPDLFHLAPIRELHARPLIDWITAAESGEPIKIADFLLQLGVINGENKKGVVEAQLKLLLKHQNDCESRGDVFPENKHVLLGYLFSLTEKNDEARNCFSAFKDINVNAQVGLACLYQLIDQDIPNAIKCFEDALKKCPTHPLALCHLGVIHQEKKNYPLAINYYKQAEIVGNASACGRLGMMIFQGEGVVRNPNLAVQYWRKAATRGDLTSLLQLGKNSYSTDPREALRLLRIPFEFGERRAYFHMGTAFFDGKGVSKDVKEAIRLWSIVAEQKHVTAYSVFSAKKLGVLYSQEEKHPELKNIKLSAFYFRKAVEGGNAESRQLLTNLFDKYKKEPEVIYHAAMAINLPPLREAFNQLALSNPEVFDSLSDQDVWEKVKSALPEETARIVFARKHKVVSQAQVKIKEICPFSSDVTRIVSAYLTNQSLFKAIREHEEIEKEVKQVLNEIVQMVSQNSTGL